MKQETYHVLEQWMHRCMTDSAHDREHVYRVVFTALDIAREEENVDMDVLIAACLLHDVGRQEQFADPRVCHAQVGARKAYEFLVENGFDEDFALRVRHCILAHRFRKSNPPESLEAKILFDADKLDVTGAIGIARTLMYSGQNCRALYSVTESGQIRDGEGDTEDSFFREYKFKLEKIYDRFYTKKGREEAMARKAAAVSYYENLLREVRRSYDGRSCLESLLEE